MSSMKRLYKTTTWKQPAKRVALCKKQVVMFEFSKRLEVVTDKPCHEFTMFQSVLWASVMVSPYLIDVYFSTKASKNLQE